MQTVTLSEFCRIVKKVSKTLNVGRVMTPTLAMAVMREAAIAAFQPEPFYTVQIGLDGFTATSERFKEKSEAEAVRKRCSVATVTKAERWEKSEKPPALYDLTRLQRDANRMLGFTAQQMELSFDSFHHEYNLTLKGSMSHKVTLGTDARGNMIRLDNALAGISERLERVKEQLSNLGILTPMEKHRQFLIAA